ncbi:unnamed protein product [Sphagnum troendelagicum]|uniref:Uncharacterized protein n=1 Tax=Sphagnum troendelagicum TaxID=128251 RepID=A0ABP0TZ47_9BRYO
MSRQTLFQDKHAVEYGLQPVQRSTSKVIEQHRSATNNAKLSGLNDHMVAQFVRVLLAISLHIISDVLTDPMVWAFSLAIDCVLHQLDIIVKNSTHGVLDEAFYKVAHMFSVHLRAQQILIIKMGSKCPKDMTWWFAFSNILRWLLEHRHRLMIHVANKRPVQTPSMQWWVTAGALAPLFERIAVTFAMLQSSNLVMSQQRQEVLNLMADILADGLQIQTERDFNNNDKESEAPPVMPTDLIKMRLGVFINEVVDQYRGHLAKQWSMDLIDKAKSEHRELLAIYTRKSDVKAALDKHDEKMFFNKVSQPYFGQVWG